MGVVVTHNLDTDKENQVSKKEKKDKKMLLLATVLVLAQIEEGK